MIRRGARIGLSIDDHMVVAAHKGRGGTAACARALLPDEPFAGAVRAVLADVRRMSRRPPTVSIVVGGAFGKVKNLERLPALSAADLSALVRENRGRFFVNGAETILTSRVEMLSDGGARCAALDRGAVREIVGACAAADVRPVLVAPLAAVGAGEASEQAAMRARDLSARNPLSIRADETGAIPRRPVPAWRAHVAIALAVGSAAWLGAAIPIAAARTTRVAKAQLSGIARHQQVALDIGRSLAAANDTLADLLTFERARRPALGVLNQLTDALDTATSLLSVEYDSAGGSLLVLSPAAAQAMTELRDARSITNLSLAGGVRMDSTAGRRLQRFSIRFTWARPQ